MTVRPFRAEDEPVLRDAYLRRGFEGGWRPLVGTVSAWVVADGQDRPVALVAAHVLAEVRCVVDPEWETPAWREQALILAHDAMFAELKAMGFRRASSLLEGAIGKGFSKRMKRLRGWAVSRGIAVEREI